MKKQYTAPTISPEVSDVSLNDFDYEDIVEYMENNGYVVYDKDCKYGRNYTIKETVDEVILFLQKHNKYDLINKLNDIVDGLE